jgi:hypothetical protein
VIIHSLACARGHCFEGWFASSEACERQSVEGLLVCPTCASPDVRKLPAAPYVRGAREERALPAATMDEKLRRQVRAALRRLILENTEDVGRRFPQVARRIHRGEEEVRDIRGEVTSDEALELLEEGVEAIALPSDLVFPEKAH